MGRGRGILCQIIIIFFFWCNKTKGKSLKKKVEIFFKIELTGKKQKTRKLELKIKTIELDILLQVFIILWTVVTRDTIISRTLTLSDLGNEFTRI